jgi:hypothetical protein
MKPPITSERFTDSGNGKGIGMIKRLRDFERAMPVGIGLDHGDKAIAARDFFQIPVVLP